MNEKIDISSKVIETKRLLLRPFIESDLEDFYTYASVPGVGERAGWPHHETIETSKQILDIFIKHKKTFALVYKENQRVIGSLGIEKYDEELLKEFSELKGREIGYVLSKEYWGKGLVPEALKAVISYLFEEVGLDFISCSYYFFNEQSKRVQEKCGFQYYKNFTSTSKVGTYEAKMNILRKEAYFHGKY